MRMGNRKYCSTYKARSFRRYERDRTAAEMVDVVRYRLEWVADALDDLKRRGLFSRSKNAEIVGRRRDLYYRLKHLIPAEARYYRLHFGMRGGPTAFATSGSVPSWARSSKRNKPRRRARGSARITRRSGRSTSPISLGLEDLGWLLDGHVRYKADLELWFEYIDHRRKKKGMGG